MNSVLRKQDAESSVSYSKVNLAVITISGFSQKVWKSTGMGDLFWDIRDEHARRPDFFFEHLPWDADFEHEACKIKLHAATDIQIVVVAYSWGCGNGVRRLAKHLARLGFEIDLLILIDPVLKRPGFWGSPRQLWALTRWGRFEVPRKVISVASYRQVNRPPYGRTLKFADSKTLWVGETVFGSPAKLARYGNRCIAPFTQIVNSDIGHADMDNHSWIRDQVRRRVRSFILGEYGRRKCAFNQ